MVNAAERLEDLRDLKRQVKELGGYDDQEIIFKDTSPNRRWVNLWSMENGERVSVLEHYAEAFLSKTKEDGSPRFTARQENAPPFRMGTVKCFMAEDSPERAILEEIGIFKVCPAEHLANEFAKERHAAKKHKDEWGAYQAHLAALERQEDRDMRRQEVAAMMAMAGQSPEAPRGHRGRSG